MKYLSQFHKEKTERCLRKMKEWQESPMTLEEQLDKELDSILGSDTETEAL